MTGAIRAASALCLAWVIGGCAPPMFVSAPNIGERLPRLKKIALLPPRIEVYEVGAGRILERRADWSRTGTENVSRAFVAELGQRRRIQVSQIDAARLDALRSELEQTQLLFDAVSAAVVAHIYGAPRQRFPDKVASFQYSLGAETANLNVGDADAFLIVKCIDYSSTAGRQALQATTMLAAAALGRIYIPPTVVSPLFVALVDARSGDILWYTISRSEGGHQLHDSASAAAFVRNVLVGFPVH